MSRVTFDGRLVRDDTADTERDLVHDVWRWPWQVRRTVASTTCGDDAGTLLRVARRLSERRALIGGH